MGRPASSASIKRNTFKASLNSPRRLPAAGLAHSSTDGTARRPLSEPSRVQHESTTNVHDVSSEDLKSLVLKLSSQVEHLTAVVAEQQKLDQPQLDED